MTGSPDRDSVAPTLRARDVLAFGIGTIVGVGWIVAVGDWIVRAGPGGAAAAFVIGALFVSLVSRCYGDAAQRFPDRGGEILLARHVFGGQAAYSAGCALIMLYLTAITFEAAALGWLCIEIGSALRLSPFAVHVGAVSVQLLVMSAVGVTNYRGTVASAHVQDVLTVIKVVGICTLVVIGIAIAKVDHAAPAFDHRQGEPAWLAMIALAASTPFWFAGFNVIAQATAERSAHTTTQQIARAMTASVLIAGVLYAGIIIAVGGLLPRTTLAALPLPAADAFAIATGWPPLKWIVLAIGMLGIIAAWNGMVFALVRVVRAVATADFLNLSPQAQAQAPVSAPRYALAAAMIAALAGIVIGRPAMNPAISASAVCISIVFAVVCAATLVLRWRERRSSAQLAVPIGGLLLSLGMVAAAVIIPAVSTGAIPPEWFILAPAVLLAWLLWRRRPA